ncbi:MAG: hypothetical protein BWX99_02110 [Deltaproteobacteria bacterium ADurb.Bin151]|nr:MAG: hypothetical protein BWX99_02110 [Deltaproteobacteria bacterium ADurb.Bin151]
MIIHQILFDGFFFLPGSLPGIFHFFIRQQTPCDKKIKTGLAAAGETPLIVKGNAQDLGNFNRQTDFFFCKFALAVFSVEDLDNSHELIFIKNRDRQDLFGSKSGFFVPASVKCQFKVHCFEFGLVIGIGDIDKIKSVGHIPGDTVIVNRNTDFLELGTGKKHGVDFIVELIDNINRNRLSVKQIQDAIFQIDQDLWYVLCCVNAVADFLKTFSYPQFFIHKDSWIGFRLKAHRKLLPFCIYITMQICYFSKHRNECQ